VLLFIATVVAANTLTARYGLIPVALGLTATAGTAAAGLTLLARDRVRHVAGRPIVLCCIVAGATLSGVWAGPRPADIAGIRPTRIGTGGLATDADTPTPEPGSRQPTSAVTPVGVSSGTAASSSAR
jgi:hypothetical protein